MIGEPGFGEVLFRRKKASSIVLPSGLSYLSGTTSVPYSTLTSCLFLSLYTISCPLPAVGLTISMVKAPTFFCAWRESREESNRKHDKNSVNAFMVFIIFFDLRQ